MSDLLQAKQIFVDALLACWSFNATQTRNTIVGELPFGDRIERSPKNWDDVWNIVSSALDWPDGIDLLVGAIRPFEGSSIPFQRLDPIAQHVKYIHTDGKAGRLLEDQDVYSLADKIARDFPLTSLFSFLL